MKNYVNASFGSIEYFGRHGAIATSRATLHREQPLVLTETKLCFIIEHIEVLSSAITFATEGSIIQRMHVPHLLVQVNHWANLVWQFSTYRRNLNTKGHYVLMSVWARTLQVFGRLGLVGVLTKKSASLHTKLMDSFKIIKTTADTESCTYKSSYNGDISPATRLHLLGMSILYQLNKHGLHDYEKSTDVSYVKEVLWWYARCHSFSTDPEMVQFACQLFRAIGYNREAKETTQRWDAEKTAQRWEAEKTALRF